MWFLTIRNMVICLDDIERRGKNLPVRDVLGLVSSLKERKGCKVSLILNDEALEEDKKDFDAYYEKVVDTSLSFAPTPTECAQIALTPNCGALHPMGESAGRRIPAESARKEPATRSPALQGTAAILVSGIRPRLCVSASRRPY